MFANKEVPNRIFLSFLALFPSISPNSDNIGNINGFLLSKVASPDPLEFFLSHPPSHPNFPPLTLSEPGPGHRSPDLLFYFWHQYLDPLTPGSNPEVNAELARLMQLPANHIGRSELALTYLQEMKEKGIPLSTREQIAVFITIGSSVAITPEGQLIHLSNDLTSVPITLDELAAIVQEKVSRTIGQIGVGAWNQTIEALGQLTENSGAIVNGLLTRLYLEEDPFCDGDGESPPNTTPSAPIFLPILETAPAHALPLQPDLATPTPYPTLEPDIIFKETMTALLEKLQSPKEQMLEISMSVDSHRKQIETQIAGAFSKNKNLIRQIKVASQLSGERVWPMPMPADYQELIKSQIADLANISSRRWGGAITAALFLKQFIKSTPWLHLDIAGPAWEEVGVNPYIPKGATGFGVRLLAEFVRLNENENNI